MLNVPGMGTAGFCKDAPTAARALRIWRDMRLCVYRHVVTSVRKETCVLDLIFSSFLVFQARKGKIEHVASGIFPKGVHLPSFLPNIPSLRAGISSGHKPQAKAKLVVRTSLASLLLSVLFLGCCEREEKKEKQFDK
jgi:hypothetical protein